MQKSLIQSDDPTTEEKNEALLATVKARNELKEKQPDIFNLFCATRTAYRLPTTDQFPTN
jgi:hypothetical protein